MNKKDTLIEVKIVRSDLDEQVFLPAQHSVGAAGYDLRCALPEAPIIIHSGETIKVPTGVAVFIRDINIVGVLSPRSSLGSKLDIMLANTVGIIDSDYQGELVLFLRSFCKEDVSIVHGQRLAQILFVPIIHPTLKVVDSFIETTERGKKGIGSTGV